MKNEFLFREKFIDEDLMAFNSAVRDHFLTDGRNIGCKLSDRRSLSANAQVHVWCKQIAESTGEDIKTVFARMKKDQGLPILLDDVKEGPIADYILKQCNFWRMNERQQLTLVDAMEVTRKFSTSQHNLFRDNVQQFYNSNGFNLQYMEKE